MLLEVLGSVLAAYTKVTLKHDRCIPVLEEQGIVIRLVEQPEALDPGDGALRLGAHIDPLDRDATLEQCRQIRR